MELKSDKTWYAKLFLLLLFGYIYIVAVHIFYDQSTLNMEPCVPFFANLSLIHTHVCSHITHTHTGELVSEVQGHLLKLPSPISLATLANLENHVVESAGVADFSSLCCGSFLSLIAGHDILLSQLSGGVMGSEAAGGDAETKKKMMRIVDQLGHQLKYDEVRILAVATTLRS